METIKINNTILEFNNIIYVATNGSNDIGDGSTNSPYLTVDKALQESVDGDCIYIKEGIYRLNPILILEGYQDGGIYDYGKATTIIGEKEKTVLEFYGSDGTQRDNVLMSLANENSLITNLKLNYYPPNKTTNYSKSLFLACKGNVKNVVIENISQISWSYSYYNSGTVGSPNVENCIFKSNGYSADDYSGTPLYKNCLFDKSPSNGTKSYCKIRTIEDKDFNMPDETSDLFCSGDPNMLNPDGSQAHIGVYGGEFSWGDWVFPELENFDLSQSNHWYSQINDIILSATLTCSNLETQIQYKILLNENQIYPTDYDYSLLQLPPINLNNILITKDYLNSGINTLKILIRNEGGIEEEFAYDIIIEDKNTIQVIRKLDFASQFNQLHPDKTQILYGEGLSIKPDISGFGAVTTTDNSNVVTLGRSTISNVAVNGIKLNDIVETIDIVEDMQNKQVLGEGYTWEYPIDLSKYKRLNNINIGII